MRWAQLFAIFVEVLMGSVLLAFFRSYRPVALITFIVAGLTTLYYLFSPTFIIISLKKQYLLWQDNLPGQHTLTIGPEGVVDLTNERERQVRWNEIDNMALSDNYLFITAGSGPIILPKIAFSDKKVFENFVNLAKAYYKAERKKYPPRKVL